MGGVGGNLDPGSSGRFPKFPGILCRRKSNGTVRPDWKIPLKKGPPFQMAHISRFFVVPGIFENLQFHLENFSFPLSLHRQLHNSWQHGGHVAVHATNVHSVCRDLPLLIQAFSKCTNALLFQKSVVLCNC